MKTSLVTILLFAFFAQGNVQESDQADRTDYFESKENMDSATFNNANENISDRVLVKVKFLEPKAESISLNDLNSSSEQSQSNQVVPNTSQTIPYNSDVVSSIVGTPSLETGYSSVTATNTYVVPTQSLVSPNTTCITNPPETSYIPTPVTQSPIATPTTVPCEQPGQYQPQPPSNNSAPENAPTLDCTKIAVLNAGDKKITQYLCFQFSL